MHWADQLAEQIIERAQKEKRTANIKCQQTPSGGKHIGNLNDVARAYLPYKSLLEKGHKAEFVHTTDDRDPLKDVPFKLPDLKGNWHSSKDLMDMSKYLGMPLFKVPDPFECCASWSAHFTKVWMDGVYSLGMHPQLFSVNALYEQGKFEPYVRKVFEKAKEVGEIVAKFQATKGKDYIPFDGICPNCGKLANVDSFDLQKKTVHFICGGKAIKKKKSEGCGEESTVPWSQGKLQWRFEWPALWGIFNTTFEPFGKDHFEGSWKSGTVIAKEVFGFEPPIPFVYEFFLVNGEKMSASKGNVYIVQDMLKVMEPEAFLFFYAKRPEKQRNLELSRIFALEDEFDAAERVYFGAEEERTENREENTKRMYDLAVAKPPSAYSRRVSYSFAASLIQLLDENKALEKLKELGHVKTEREVELARQRLGLARNWIESYAGDEMKIRLLAKEKSQHFRNELGEKERSALKEFASVFEKEKDLDRQMEKIKELCAANSIQIQDFFKSAYLVLLGKEKGPKLIPFINSLEKKLVLERLRGE